MAAPAIPTDPSSAATATSALLNEILGFLRYLEGFETETPALTQSVSASPSIGNGTLTCYYQLVGKTLTAIYLAVSGSTTSWLGGSVNNWTLFPLPEGSTVTGDKQRQTLTGVAWKAADGDSGVYGVHADVVDSTTLRLLWTEDGTNGSQFLDGFHPFDFDTAAGNVLVFAGTMAVD